VDRGRPFSLDVFRPSASVFSTPAGRSDHWISPIGAQPGGEDREIILPSGDENAGVAGGDRLQILFVEDDLRFVELVERILADGAPEFDVVHAPRVSAALARLVREPTRLILTDLRLPDSAGAETVRHLTRAAPNVPLIVLSGSSELDIALECIRDGAEEYVLKRALDAEALIRLIRITMERRRRLAEQWTAAYDDPLTGVQGPAALEAVGRQLLSVSDRTGLSIGVLALRAEGHPATLAEDRSRIVAVADILHRTVRRCDVIARVEPNQLAVILVGGLPRSYAAGTRIGGALAPLSGGGLLRMGIAFYDCHQPRTIQQLLARARDALLPVEAS
jgi:DNA-binding NarL/FixJ family response regulator